jgi:CRP-like cAMP-binding protein
MNHELQHPELPAMSLLAGLADEDRALLGNYGDFLPVQPGQVLISEGQPQDSLYFIISGLLHVTREIDGRVSFITRIAAGETLGEVNVFDPGTASASVVAKEFSQVWKASREDIEAFVAAYPEAGARLLAGVVACMSRRLRHMNDRLANESAISDIASLWQS